MNSSHSQRKIYLAVLTIWLMLLIALMSTIVAFDIHRAKTRFSEEARQRYEQANEVFYDLWLHQPEGSDIWWTALLRSLQVNTRLKADPQRILNEIRKQRFLRPDLGGPVRREQFARLEQINEQRLAQSNS